MVVIGIATDWGDLGQRGGKQPPDRFLFSASCKDRRVAVTVAVPQAGREKSKARFIEERRRVMQNELALMGELQNPAGNAFGKKALTRTEASKTALIGMEASGLVDRSQNFGFLFGGRLASGDADGFQ
jgi:hypothetical protein